MARVHVISPGLQTTVQDRGRWGLQSRGVPVAGPMDSRSHRTANALLGNDPSAATLEVTLVGPEVEFEDARHVAVCGAAFELTVDGDQVPMNAAFSVSAGSRMKFGSRAWGARAYLAIAGGVAVPPLFGSRSTHVATRMGGFEGRALIAGDRVPLGEIGNVRLKPDTTGDRLGEVRLKPDTTGATITATTATTSVVSGFSRTFDVRRMSGSATRIRVLPGPQRERFTEDALDALQSAPYEVERDSDRMAFRLHGPMLGHAKGADIISDATPLGVLQVPASGQPMLLMADRPTTGGYPKLATVITADIPTAAQLAPGDTISFEVCSLGDAIAALIAEERALMAIEAGR